MSLSITAHFDLNLVLSFKTNMPNDRATAWSLTINNPTAADEESIALARQKGWKVSGQRERGEEGTEHYQLLLQTPQVRFAAVKKIFARAHIEVCRNLAALSQYVAKDSTRVGAIPVAQAMYPTQATFFELVWDRILADPTRSEFHRHPGGRLKSPKNALTAAAHSLISDGYVVESIATNPMTISSWVDFHDAFLARRDKRRQTDTASPERDSSLAEIHNHASHRSSSSSSGDAPPPLSQCGSEGSGSSSYADVPVQPSADLHGDVCRKSDSV